MVIEQKLHVVPEHHRRRVTTRVTCVCRWCGERTTGEAPASPFERSKATCEWLAWLVVQKFVLLTPLDRIRRDLASRGIALSMGYLVSQIERASDLLGAVDGEHWKALLAGNWLATDATGIKVRIPKVSGTYKGYLEVYRREDLVVMQYEATKDGKILAGKLGRFQGVLVADAEHRHNEVFADGRVLEAGCNAHGRRKFEAAEHVQPVLAVEGGRFVSLMYVAENEAQRLGLTGEALKSWRQEHIGPLFVELERWMDSVYPTLTWSDTLAAVIRYYRNHWMALRRFVDHPEIPMDNSGSEREFQNVAKYRNNCLFAGSTEGAIRAAVLLGIVATCRAIGVNTQAYLTWAFTRLGTHRDRYGLNASQLTPAAFADSRAGP